MSAPISAAKSAAPQRELLLQSQKDLNRAITGTTEEMAKARDGNYLSERSWTSFKGITNIYYHLLCVKACDPMQKVETLVRHASPQIQADITLLEQIRTKTGGEQTQAIEKAIRSGLKKDTLKSLFSTLDIIFMGRSYASRVLDAIDKTMPIEEKVEKVATLPAAITPAAAPSTRTVTVLSNTSDDEKVARELQDEENLELQRDLSGDADTAQHLQEQEEAFAQALDYTDATRVGEKRAATSDEAFARELQEQEEALAQVKRARPSTAAPATSTNNDAALALQLQQQEERQRRGFGWY